VNRLKYRKPNIFSDKQVHLARTPVSCVLCLSVSIWLDTFVIVIKCESVILQVHRPVIYRRSKH